MSRVRWGRAMAAFAVIAAVSACSPTMNWRKAPLAAVAFNLPCKPDSATRNQRIGDKTLSLAIMGCEAGGALFAISQVTVPDEAAARDTQSAWQQQALQSMRAGAPVAAPWTSPPWSKDAISIQATGVDPQGIPIQARLSWFRHEQNLYHLAVYAPKVSPEWALTFLEDISLL
ncbi:hypothetical protein os4_03160 [Comamonadaceae bacterium OS-4]|nr:hypothetical protein os4_03160 [Comamonadaceae bacterium OS-4]